MGTSDRKVYIIVVHVYTCRYLKMNKTEKKAYEWLLKQGYSEDDISFSARGTPDFVCSNGKQYEAKRLYGKTIWLYEKQVEKIKDVDGVVVIFGNEIEPVLIIESSDLENDVIIDGIRLKVIQSNPPGSLTLRISDGTKAKLDSVKRLYNLDSYDDAIEYILKYPNPIRSKFYQFIESMMGKYGREERDILYNETDNRLRAYLYTGKYKYCIVANKDGTYLGCVSSSRTQDPGEDWFRGNDLGDGPFDQETMDRIKSDIIGSELEPISDYIRDERKEDSTVAPRTVPAKPTL